MKRRLGNAKSNKMLLLLLLPLLLFFGRLLLLLLLFVSVCVSFVFVALLCELGFSLLACSLACFLFFVFFLARMLNNLDLDWHSGLNFSLFLFYFLRSFCATGKQPTNVSPPPPPNPPFLPHPVLKVNQSNHFVLKNFICTVEAFKSYF